MGNILRTNSQNYDFQELVKLLDRDLYEINGNEQGDYEKHNVINNLETIVIYYEDEEPVACGAFKEFKKGCIEMKRIYVKQNFRGQGISGKIIYELEKWALELGYNRAVLETGKKQVAAIGLYTKLKYQVIDNYEPYINMPSSVCMGKTL